MKYTEQDNTIRSTWEIVSILAGMTREGLNICSKWDLSKRNEIGAHTVEKEILLFSCQFQRYTKKIPLEQWWKINEKAVF